MHVCVAVQCNIATITAAYMVTTVRCSTYSRGNIKNIHSTLFAVHSSKQFRIDILSMHSQPNALVIMIIFIHS